MAGLNNTDHFTTQGWMVTELGLTGGLLTTYALVHQFTQSRAGIYTGGPQYVAAWIGCTVGTARIYLHKLVEKGLIEAKDEAIGGVLYRNYRAAEPPLRNSYPPTKIVAPPYENRSQKNKEKEPTNVGIYSSTPLTPRKSFDFRAALVDAGVEPSLADDWLQVRKAKKAAPTRTAFDETVREFKLAGEAGKSPDDCIRFAVVHSWAGFRWKWMQAELEEAQQQRPHTPTPRPGRAGYMDRARDAARELGIIEEDEPEQQ